MAQAQARPYFLVGRIQAAHGLLGLLRVFPMTDDPERFKRLKTCLLLDPKEKIIRSVTVQSAKVHSHGSVLVQLDSVTDRTAAEQLRGCFLAVSRDMAEPLPEGRWYIADLIGCTVTDSRHGELGQVADILQHGSQDVYVIRQPGQPDLLFPALKSILRLVDVAAGHIHITLPEGLWEVYREGKR